MTAAALSLPVLSPIARGEGAHVSAGVTGSSTDRGLQCLASTVLPRVDTKYPKIPAEKGIVIHDFLLVLATEGRQAAINKAPDKYREAVAGLDTAKLPTLDAKEFQYEVAFALDPVAEKSRLLGSNLNRQYGQLGVNEIPITLDVLGFTADGKGVIYPDYKSGWRTLPPPAKHEQMRTGVLAAATYYGRSYGVPAHIHVPDGARSSIDVGRTLEAYDLAVIMERLRQLVERRAILFVSFNQRGYAGLGNSVVTGPECQYCPCAMFCPAQYAFIRAAVDDQQGFIRGVMDRLDARDVGAARAMVVQLGATFELLDKQVKAAAEREPAQLENGNLYGPVLQSDPTYDAAAVYDQVRALLVERQGLSEEQAQQIASETSHDATKAGIRRALAPVAPKGQLEAMVREAIARIKSVGGVVQGTKTVYREYALKGIV